MYIMTQRQEVRFNVYNRTANIISTGVNMPYDIIDFNEGGGTYDTTTYQYTFSVKYFFPIFQGKSGKS